jgi:acyl carrier protein phosphodiesterase
MNYLGHLYFSDDNHALMLANLFGDFVKGKDLSAYHPSIQHGITLHRSIDKYIDSHPEVLRLLKILYPHLPKVSGIAVDLFFDHLLAKNWEQHHPQQLPDFLDRFYCSIDSNISGYTPEFQAMIQQLVRVNWISYYPRLDGLEKALHGVSSKISFPNELKNGIAVFNAYETEIISVFERFMTDARQHFNVSYSK